MSTLVIVESPAKAKTIARFLGSGYEVMASVGHVRDLPESASEIPAELKKQKWAKLGVNVDSEFEPLYIVPSDKKRHVDSLARASREASEILLATDDDREGESISWHILQVLKPKKGTKIARIVFHELTPEAIKNALKQPRQVDENLVKAQETRRILDRLYGYTLSPLLWKKVAPKLSAGRVQSVAVRLVVMRERERKSFVSAEYWDLVAMLGTKDGQFKSTLIRVDSKKIASSKSFDPGTGKADDDALVWSAAEAGEHAAKVRESKPWTVTSLDAKPGIESPPKPFQTSTLQQEASRKLGFGSKRTMQIAQNLYEGIDLGGERIGLITYMRTDSLSLADQALAQAREVIRNLYGNEYLPAKAVHYKTKSKGAQEAHEAIRPTDLSRRPQDVKAYLTKEQYDLYELIWKRTIACQMVAARVRRTVAEITTSVETTAYVFRSSGKEILFPGFLRAYVEGTDDPEAELGEKESLLPPLEEGKEVDLVNLDTAQHRTTPPARYTEASLIAELESEGIGRPSTYAAIMSTIQDRGYVFRKGKELVPTFTAFAVVELLEDNFRTLVDTTFTAQMEDQLDEIAEGQRDATKHLRDFYFGNRKDTGILTEVEAKGEAIPYPQIELGNDPSSNAAVVVRVGRYGTFVQRGDPETKDRVTVPAEIAPADLKLEDALRLLATKGIGGEAFTTDPATGRDVFVKSGRFGSYVELAQTPEEAESGEKPRRASLPDGIKATTITPEEAVQLLQFPRELGNHPENGLPITVILGRYGPFVKNGEEIRNVADWKVASDLSMESAVGLLAQPKEMRRGRGAATTRTPVEPLKTFGNLEGCEGPVKILDGRYGPYATDGKTNATLPKGRDPQSFEPEEVRQLILERAGQPKTKRKPMRRAKR
jgi:DNA topoisomerase I